ncbi:hypothetical protein Sjap_015080 [Stephania japonica]|uniref:Uncharacterized protein n=1 Tax=Stephania japonica TaxID=461633 RepID=A0AAP0IJJ0_9MAGN
MYVHGAECYFESEPCRAIVQKNRCNKNGATSITLPHLVHHRSRNKIGCGQNRTKTQPPNSSLHNSTTSHAIDPNRSRDELGKAYGFKFLPRLSSSQ